MAFHQQNVRDLKPKAAVEWSIFYRILLWCQTMEWAQMCCPVITCYHRKKGQDTTREENVQARTDALRKPRQCWKITACHLGCYCRSPPMRFYDGLNKVYVSVQGLALVPLCPHLESAQPGVTAPSG
ncbi:hypothetical protein GDO78_018927 [Eleutherodactylus coqui]|uniref:Uncharacterized protein n=1 Tax=Eleutherodactylus coqui TaxID=57060 RepID=A0A8J6BJZ1_ELECQ|nr:hypothetical protein GDO78_018927 [Eleutherodactylus coqui]